MEVVTMAHELDIGNISGKSFQEHLDYFIDKMVQYNIGGGEKYNGLISGTVELGNYVDMGGYTWLVCHVDEGANEFYLILNTITEKTQFGNNTNYAGSTIAAKCASFLATLPGPVQTLLKMTSVEGVTAKIFIPTYDQVKGGFSWFNSINRRIAYNESGAAQQWWTSTENSSSGVWYVDTTGNLGYYGPAASVGFRPTCRIALT